MEETKQANLEIERLDHVQRHFRFDWQEVAKFNPAYLRFVESERARLGENHPLFRTQYSLLPISGAGYFLTRQQRVLLEGTHSRLSAPQPSQVYVAGIDLAGAIEQDKETLLSSSVSRRDSTVITIAKVSSNSTFRKDPEISVVEHFEWQDVPHSQLYPKMVEVIKKWDLKRVVVDATGIGEPVASFLKAQFGHRILSFVFTARSKSELGFDLLAAVNSTRLKFYKPDNSEQYRRLMLALEHAVVQYRPNQTMNFFVPPGEGHDDYLSSLALLVLAAKDYRPRIATGTRP